MDLNESEMFQILLKKISKKSQKKKNLTASKYKVATRLFIIFQVQLNVHTAN